MHSSGCVPPASYHTGVWEGFPNRDTPLDRDPLDREPPDRDPLDREPSGQRPHLLHRDPPDRDPRGQRPPPDRDPLIMWTESPSPCEQNHRHV